MAAGYRTRARSRIRPGRPPEPHPLTEDELAAAAEQEREATERARRWQLEADRFRTDKEVAKARYAAADGAARVQQTLLTVAGQTQAERAEARQELAGARARLTAAAAALTDLSARAQVLIRSARGDTGAGVQVTPGLLELRADQLGADVRILSAAVPSGTLTLLAVLTDADANDEHRDQALVLAGELLTELRAADADTAPADWQWYTDAGQFLDRFLPGQREVTESRAAALASAQSLAGLRRSAGLSLADLAPLTGLSERELWRLETGDLSLAPIHEVAAYVRALGHTLTLNLAATQADSGPTGLI